MDVKKATHQRYVTTKEIANQFVVITTHLILKEKKDKKLQCQEGTILVLVDERVCIKVPSS